MWPCPLNVFVVVPSGTEGRQCGGECVCGSGRRRQLVFPTNCGLLAVAALPPHPEPESPSSAVGWFLLQHNICTALFRSPSLIVIPNRFQWNIPEDDQGFISVEPEAGVLQPNENSVSHQNVTG